MKINLTMKSTGFGVHEVFAGTVRVGQFQHKSSEATGDIFLVNWILGQPHVRASFPTGELAFDYVKREITELLENMNITP